MVTISISEWFTYERELIMSFSEKMNAKSFFRFGHSDKVWIDAKKITEKPPLHCHSLDANHKFANHKSQITNLHRNCKNKKKNKNMAPF